MFKIALAVLMITFAAFAVLNRPSRHSGAIKGASPQLSAGDQAAASPAKMAKWKIDCEEKGGFSCTKYGRAVHAKNPNVAKIYFERGCKTGCGISCEILDTMAAH